MAAFTAIRHPRVKACEENLHNIVVLTHFCFDEVLKDALCSLNTRRERQESRRVFQVDETSAKFVLMEEVAVFGCSV